MRDSGGPERHVCWGSRGPGSRERMKVLLRWRGERKKNGREKKKRHSLAKRESGCGSVEAIPPALEGATTVATAVAVRLQENGYRKSDGIVLGVVVARKKKKKGDPTFSEGSVHAVYLPASRLERWSLGVTAQARY